VYACDVEDGAVSVRMTLTAPGCGMGPVLVEDVRSRVAQVPNVREVAVDLVFDPPWSRDMMTEEAQLELGLF
jgi:metal-sulfur cluster biosynthetic enzyme